MPPRTVNEARPLTPAEQRDLSDLLARQYASQPVAAPTAVRIGSPYQALVNLSVPRRGDPEKQVDLVRPGETIYLTDEEARGFMARGGRQVDCIRKLDGPAGNTMPKVNPRQLSGRVLGPPADARPDPAGSSTIQVRETALPEENEPKPGSENTPAPPPFEVDAIDIPPRPKG
jgi:hypothetical protein